jgi:hypothetical protein
LAKVLGLLSAALTCRSLLLLKLQLLTGLTPLGLQMGLLQAQTLQGFLQAKQAHASHQGPHRQARQ